MFCLPQSARAEELKPPAIGAQVPDVPLVDIYRRERTLSDSQGKQAIVLAVLGVDCPLANLYIPRLNEMHAEYASKGVQFAVINSNPQDTMVQVAAHALETKMTFPVLKDFEQKALNALGAKRTPEVFLLDGDFKIRYHGRIDDQFTISHRRPEPQRLDLKIAIDELLAGDEITVTETNPHGCLIPRWEDQLPREEITYASHIAKLFDNKCYRCHREGQVGPFALEDYRDAKTWAEPIYEAVVEQRMPPWHAEDGIHSFLNNRSLTQTEIEQVVKWVKADCPSGNLEQVPEKPVVDDEWSIGIPDLVIEMPREEQVPSTGVVPYRYQTAELSFDEDVWVQAAEARPGTTEVVHHILAYINTPRRDGEGNVKKGFDFFGRDGSVGLLVGWAPGDMPQIYPEGYARKIPKGSQIVFELHYTPDGVARTDRSSVAIKFTKEPPQHEIRTNFMAQTKIEIPAHRFRHQDSQSFTFRKEARIISLMPHMHWRGLSADYFLEYPDGTKKEVMSVPYYDFNWQSIYRFENPLEVPPGTKLTVVGTWDNTADNPNNPDPSKTVYWGQQTWEEMLAGWVDYVYVDSDAVKTSAVEKPTE
ncbi:redoxin domain-containing protein [Polystyrenella longa]|nr:redoxin domain-containing protein [Polystyrenella longa]